MKRRKSSLGWFDLQLMILLVLLMAQTGIGFQKPFRQLSPCIYQSFPNTLTLPRGRIDLISPRSSALTSPRQQIRSNAITPASSSQPIQQQTKQFKRSFLSQLSSWPRRQFQEMRGFFQAQSPMLRYLWPKDNPSIRVYLLLSMMFMYLGNWFSLKVPFILQNAIDSIASNGFQRGAQSFSSLLKPIQTAFLLYGLTRTAAVVCAEIKASLFSHVSQNVLKKFAYQIFEHLHALDSAFHLTTPSGVISVAYVRAVRGFQTMLLEIVFSIAPAALDLAMVSAVLYKRFGARFSTITLTTFSAYLLFTIWMTQYRVKLRKELVEVDNARNGFLIDSILNHEVVKLFTNEKKETSRFDSFLQRISKLSIDCTYLIALLNIGQAVLFSSGLAISLLFALQQVQAGLMTVGDLVAVNAMLLQLAVPFNNMGYTYQELRQSLVDMGYIRKILEGQQPAIKDSVNAVSLDVLAPRHNRPSTVEFRNVSFSYIERGQGGAEGEAVTGSNEVLKGISFTINRGENIALVGPSGSGKSTTLKLITRMLEASEGEVLVDGVNVKEVTLDSLRGRIAVVPQDTCLFDQTIDYNIRYGRSSASVEEVERAIERSNLQQTIEKFPLGLQTTVGERGARLSGGERQKVSIARAILRNPSLILCDEVTSSVDAFAEKDIIETLRSATQERTTVTVAHRLSSIAHSDKIFVLQKGRIVEVGNHEELLKIPEGVYRRMWQAQNELAIQEAATTTPSTSTSTTSSSSAAVSDERVVETVSSSSSDRREPDSHHLEIIEEGGPVLSLSTQKKKRKTQKTSSSTSTTSPLEEGGGEADHLIFCQNGICTRLIRVGEHLTLPPPGEEDSGFLEDYYQYSESEVDEEVVEEEALHSSSL